MKTSTCFSTF